MAVERHGEADIEAVERTHRDAESVHLRINLLGDDAHTVRLLQDLGIVGGADGAVLVDHVASNSSQPGSLFHQHQKS